MQGPGPSPHVCAKRSVGLVSTAVGAKHNADGDGYPLPTSSTSPPTPGAGLSLDETDHVTRTLASHWLHNRFRCPRVSFIQ